ncbi:hypothetical protein D3C72_1680140 [compost metagenome]
MFVHVQFAAQHGALVLGIVERPAGIQQGFRFWRTRHGQAGGQVDAPVQTIGAVLAVVQVGGHAGIVATPVQAYGDELGLLFLMIDGALAIAVDAVDADAELFMLAEPLSQVHMSAPLRVRHVRCRHARQRRIARALGHEVDAAAYRAARWHAIEQC